MPALTSDVSAERAREKGIFIWRFVLLLDFYADIKYIFEWKAKVQMYLTFYVPLIFRLSNKELNRIS